MSAATLYELASFRETLDAIIGDAEGEITPEQEAQLDAIDGAFAEKCENVALYIVEQLALAEAIEAEEAKLKARRKAKEHRADWLRRYLQTQMERVGKTRVDGLLKTITLAKNPASVVPIVNIEDWDLRNLAMILPEFVRREPETFHLDKRAILDAAKRGPLPEDLAKRVRVEQSTGIRIR